MGRCRPQIFQWKFRRCRSDGQAWKAAEQESRPPCRFSVGRNCASAAARMASTCRWLGNYIQSSRAQDSDASYCPSRCAERVQCRPLISGVAVAALVRDRKQLSDRLSMLADNEWQMRERRARPYRRGSARRPFDASRRARGCPASHAYRPESKTRMTKRGSSLTLLSARLIASVHNARVLLIQPKLQLCILNGAR